MLNSLLGLMRLSFITGLIGFILTLTTEGEIFIVKVVTCVVMVVMCISWTGIVIVEFLENLSVRSLINLIVSIITLALSFVALKTAIIDKRNQKVEPTN